MMPNKVFIIAEAGVNHNGSPNIAKRLIDAAVKAGVDAVKFQSFKAGSVATVNSAKAKYQRLASPKRESQRRMLERLELSESEQKELAGYCQKKAITFLSSAFDMDSIDLLNRLGLKLFKIPSGEITNLPYLRKIGSLGKRIILSTGMSNLAEIRRALEVLINSGTAKKNITVLHCNTEYPTAMDGANLKAMLTIKDKFKVNIGYSDHTQGIEAAIAAVALGANVIEKHFTLARDMAGPDHKASLLPRELKAMTEAIRNIEMALGSGIKKPSGPERSNLSAVRRSIVARRYIAKGEFLTENNITTKRPGTGISPMRWDEVVGTVAKKSFKADEFIKV